MASAAGSSARSLWQRYLQALKTHPIRTRMITSATLFALGDAVAQGGIEGRRLSLLSAKGKERASDVDSVVEAGAGTQPLEWDLIRTLRIGFYGGVIFAPLAHGWLTLLGRVQIGGRWGTLATRMTCDSLMWSPFVCTLFPSSMGILEGKDLATVKRKVEVSFLPTWTRALTVFVPTQLINFTLVPPPHRLLMLQSVGFCWGVYLSYANQLNNKRLAAAALALSHAEVGSEARAEALHELDEAKAKRTVLQSQGGEEGVGQRMSWA